VLAGPGSAAAAFDLASSSTLRASSRSRTCSAALSSAFSELDEMYASEADRIMNNAAMVTVSFCRKLPAPPPPNTVLLLPPKAAPMPPPRPA
jgi:hypothetical protein